MPTLVHLHPLTSKLGRLVGRQPGPFRAARTDSDPARVTMEVLFDSDAAGGMHGMVSFQEPMPLGLGCAEP